MNTFENGRVKETRPTTQPIDLNVIRTETVFSRLPIHQLSKRGTIEIRIIQRERPGGQISLYWRVSPNSEFGQPRQLAYKLDTLIVNRGIDELGRPIPRIIRVGSLHSIAEKLGLGGDTDTVKNAFRQNALTGITARLDFKTKAGQEESIDTTFTRYNVVFRGQRLPSGDKAETVYLILNDPYLGVLNNSIARRQDYDYLAALPPTAQRFYELASFKIFAALKNGYPQAKLSYSEFCVAAPQTRYFDYEHFKKQMYKIHRPHLRSGYLATVVYQRTTDAQGRGDWVISYTPGPKAKAEFRAFSRESGSRERPKIQSALPAERQTEPIRSKPPSSGTPAGSESASAERVIQRFHDFARGVTKYAPAPNGRELRQAQDLLKKYGARRVDFLLEFAVRSARRTKFKMQTFGAVLQYVPEAMAEYGRMERDEQAARRAGAEREERIRRDDAEINDAETVLESLSREEYQTLYKRVKRDVLGQYPNIAGWKGQTIFERMIKLKMADTLRRRGETAA